MNIADFEPWYKPYKKDVQRYATSLMGEDDMRIEDVVALVEDKLLREWEGFDRLPTKSWLMQCVHHRAIEVLRGSYVNTQIGVPQRNVMAVSDGVDCSPMWLAKDDDISIDDITCEPGVCDPIVRKRIQAVLNVLPKNYVRVLWQYVVEGYDFWEIAASRKVKRQAAGQIYSRAVKAFQKEWVKQGNAVPCDEHKGRRDTSAQVSAA